MSKLNCECSLCRILFYKKPSRINDKNYCSKRCHNTSMKIGSIYRCKVCNKEVYRKPCEIRKNKTGDVFCSKKCQATEQNCFGKAAYNFKGLDVKDYRVKAMRFLPNKCNRCGYEKLVSILQVHHIDRDRHNNDISNLEILCPNCHCEEHYVINK